MENWKLLTKQEYKSCWKFVYDELHFYPANNKNTLIELPKPNNKYDTSDFYNNGFDEKFYADLHSCSMKCFKNISSKQRMYALNWQHDCYSFLPELPFEKDQFDEWLIPIFPNGDYLFFLTKNFQNGVFADGINLSISIFEKDIIREFEINKPSMF